MAGLDPEAVRGAVSLVRHPGARPGQRRPARDPASSSPSTGADAEEKVASYDLVKDDLEAVGLATHVAGQYVVFEDVNTQVSEDIARAETIAMPIVFILSLIIFGSVGCRPDAHDGRHRRRLRRLRGRPADHHGHRRSRSSRSTSSPCSAWAWRSTTRCSWSSRFREELAKRPGTGREDVAVAIERTMGTAGRTVLFSGAIVAAALSSLLVFPQNFLRSMGFGGVAAVLVAMAASLTVLPAVLTLLGPPHRVGHDAVAPSPARTGRRRLGGRARRLGADRAQRHAAPGRLPRHHHRRAAADRLADPRRPVGLGRRAGAARGLAQPGRGRCRSPTTSVATPPAPTSS